MKTENIENDETLAIDLEHPWVEASTIMMPRPVELMTKFDMVTLKYGEGEEQKTIDLALMTVVTPIGVFSFYLQPKQLNEFLMQGADILREMMETANKGIVVAGADDLQRLKNVRN